MITILPAFVAAETQHRREQLSRSWGAPVQQVLRGWRRPAPVVDRSDRPCPAVAG